MAGHRAFVVGIVNLFSRKTMDYNAGNTMDGRGRCLDNAKMERFWWA
ncbi:MAG: hypothetical protein AB7F40_04965 [Victivallaceae bacterium]